MKLLSIIFINTLLLVGCSSQKQTCKCPYQSTLNKNIDFNNLTFEVNPYLFVENKVNINDLFSISPLPLPLQEENYHPLRTNIIETAFKYEGVRYRTGGTSEKGMDCSGLVYRCYTNYGISLPRTSFDMSTHVDDVPLQEVKKGDLIFFKTNRRKNRINHVGLVIEVNGNEIKFIHASIKKGVTVSSTFDNYYSKTFVKVGRILDV